ncbi:hypothetical protein [Robertkochia solimangrovi]|uniref:hypothetical protein n=1 Tax=Robertkochia solimangrovi TaxID=2213046 RepID=UPI00117F7A91|nr:hypothetical protein [Robertkochia solimangrovi]TRZ43532.1 hypothetical protein DMZ48_08900 [Robertkochia solimangrovi]
MKTKILRLLGILLFLVACNNDDQNSQSELNGTYTGIFERNGNTSEVVLTFTNETFKGQSELEKFPALCNGTYKISGNTVTFVNGCPWTAEFDWSLILNDEWTYDLNESMLHLTKANGDKYMLTKQ